MLCEDDDEARSGFEIGFVFVGPERRERIKPLLRGPSTVESTLFFFSSCPNLAFHLGITDHHEMPGLFVGYAGSAARHG
jgi:hypothetical protein